MAPQLSIRGRVGKLQWYLLLFIVAILIGVFGANLCRYLFYNKEMYRGDGFIVDYGFMSYPRYRVTLPSLALSESGSHSYRLKGMPPSRLLLGLRLNGENASDRLAHERITNVSRMKGSIIVEIIDSNRQRLYFRDLPINQCRSTIGGDEVYLWLDQTEFRFDPSRSYNLTIEVFQPLPMEDRITIEPYFYGGGLEKL